MPASPESASDDPAKWFFSRSSSRRWRNFFMTRPTCAADVLHEDQFSPPGPNGRYRLGDATFAGMFSKEEERRFRPFAGTRSNRRCDPNGTSEDRAARSEAASLTAYNCRKRNFSPTTSVRTEASGTNGRTASQRDTAKPVATALAR